MSDLMRERAVLISWFVETLRIESVTMADVFEKPYLDCRPPSSSKQDLFKSCQQHSYSFFLGFASFSGGDRRLTCSRFGVPRVPTPPTVWFIPPPQIRTWRRSELKALSSVLPLLEAARPAQLLQSVELPKAPNIELTLIGFSKFEAGVSSGYSKVRNNLCATVGALWRTYFDLLILK